MGSEARMSVLHTYNTVIQYVIRINFPNTRIRGTPGAERSGAAAGFQVFELDVFPTPKVS